MVDQNRPILPCRATDNAILSCHLDKIYNIDHNIPMQWALYVPGSASNIMSRPFTIAAKFLVDRLALAEIGA